MNKQTKLYTENCFGFLIWQLDMEHNVAWTLYKDCIDVGGTLHGSIDVLGTFQGRSCILLP